MYRKCKERTRSGNCREKEEEMNMGVWNRNGAGGRELCNDNNNNLQVSNIRVSNRTLIYNVSPNMTF